FFLFFSHFAKPENKDLPTDRLEGNEGIVPTLLMESCLHHGINEVRRHDAFAFPPSEARRGAIKRAGTKQESEPDRREGQRFRRVVARGDETEARRVSESERGLDRRVPERACPLRAPQASFE